MVQVTFDQLQTWLAMFFWPFVRMLAFIMACPLLGHSSVPNQAKIGLAFLLAVVVSPTLAPMPDVPVYSWAGVGIIVEQVLIGVALGMVLHVIFTVVQATGEFIGLQMGLAFATFFSPDTGANTMILSRLFYMLTLLLFLALNGHLIAIEILAATFTTLPVASMSLDTGAFEVLVRFGSTIFIAGMLLAVPMVASLLIINLSMGILNRTAPQFTIFSIGFPMYLTAGLFLLMVLMGDMGQFLERLFAQGLLFMQDFVELLAGGAGE